MNNMFDEIEKERKSLPELKSVTNHFIGKRKLNCYQFVAFGLLIVGFICGILLGNMIPACSETSGMFGSCTKTEFNISLTLLFWAGTFLLSLCIYGMGHIIAVLESIDHKLK